MTGYIARRFAETALVLWGVSLVSFAVIFLAGDPASAMVGEDWTPQMIQAFRHDMGFDRPWYVQYGAFLAHAVRGDFGVSLRQHEPAMGLVADRLPATLELAVAATGLSIAVAVPVGVISATRRNSWLDQLAMLGALVGQSLPTFYLGLMLILVFSVGLGWTPVAGRGGLSHLVLPAVTLSAFTMARNARLIRSSLLEVLRAPYIATARAKGIAERAVLARHAMRNALIPVITLVGVEFGALLGGAVVTETIFAWPGVGRLVIQAIYGRDIPLVQAAVIVLATLFVFVNLAVDLLYVVLNPQIRLG